MRPRDCSLLFVTVLIVAIFAASSARAEDADSELRGALESANKEFETVFAAGDGAGMGALYTEDGELLPPNSDVVSGRTAIGEFWQAVMDAGIKSVKLETVEVMAMGDLGVAGG